MTVLSAQQRATLPLDSALSALSSASIAPEYLRALKLLRNALVGNRLRKLAFCANTEALLRYTQAPVSLYCFCLIFDIE